MATKILLRRDSAANWTTANPVLDAAEVGVETDTGRLKIGDGSTAWGALQYSDADYARLTGGADADFAAMPQVGGTPINDVGETTHTASSASFDRADGGIQEYTLTADETVSVTIDDGQSMTLHLTDGDAHTVTWPTMTWVGGSAPTLTAADVIEFWKVGSTLYGAYVGSIA